jgi:hypothetical protein
MSAKELQWDSNGQPSEVKGVLDLREATIGRTTIKEVQFQDVVEFSMTTFGQYKGKSEDDKDIVMEHSSPQVLFEHNTFEKEADFRHVTFSGSALLSNNRFHSRLDLTDASFTSPTSFLCLSFNDISRLGLEPEHFGHPPGFSPFDQFRSLFDKPPLFKSKIRQIASKEKSDPKNELEPQCILLSLIHPTTQNANTNRQVEHLDAIYKTLGQSFSEAKDQRGLNEAWYLQTVAKRNQAATIWDWVSWGFGDIPSRYAIDVWRTVWISIAIMLVFSVVYWLVLRRLVRSDDPDAHQLQVPAYPARQRAFRIRLFEPIRIQQKTTSQQKTHDERAPRFPCQILRAPNISGCSIRAKSNQEPKDAQAARDIIPWRDAAALSFRAFTKIGLGTAYPNMGTLTVLTLLIWFEWGLGVYMLIHFILAVKNNLPFIAPFLGVVN